MENYALKCLDIEYLWLYLRRITKSNWLIIPLLDW